MREVIDRDLTFWRLAPVALERSVFSGADPGFRALGWPEHEYVLGTDASRAAIVAHLPPGTWRVTRYDVASREEALLSPAARGDFRFDAPASRAVLFHFVRVGER
jgi:hypothetical protein